MPCPQAPPRKVCSLTLESMVAPSLKSPGIAWPFTYSDLVVSEHVNRIRVSLGRVCVPYSADPKTLDRDGPPRDAMLFNLERTWSAIAGLAVRLADLIEPGPLRSPQAALQLLAERGAVDSAVVTAMERCISLQGVSLHPLSEPGSILQAVLDDDLVRIYHFTIRAQELAMLQKGADRLVDWKWVKTGFVEITAPSSRAGAKARRRDGKSWWKGSLFPGGFKHPAYGVKRAGDELFPRYVRPTTVLVFQSR